MPLLKTPILSTKANNEAEQTRGVLISELSCCPHPDYHVALVVRPVVVNRRYVSMAPLVKVHAWGFAPSPVIAQRLGGRSLVHFKRT